jgi:hypothetical protein
MTTPKISLIASASRPENWQELYETIGENDTAFELIFVGPNAPKGKLPDNFIFIKSNVKPAQCWEIAARRASGELLMYVADDIMFMTENPIDKVYQLYTEKARENDKVIVSLNYRLPEGWNRLLIGDDSSPVVPLCGLLSSKLWHEIGGIDKNFIALGWDLDLVMRVLSLGGEVVLSDVYIDEEIEMPSKPRSRGSRLLRDHKSTDIVRLHELWLTDGKPHFNRALPAERLSDFEILTRSQPPEGRWKHESDLINKIITSRTYYVLKSFQSHVSGRLHRFRIRKIPTYVRKLISNGVNGEDQ